MRVVWFQVAVGLAGVVACAGTPALKPLAPLPPRPEASPIASATSPPPPKPKLFTTLPDSEECRAFEEREAPPFSKFATLVECENWVKTRKCNPGMTCDGWCNTISCDGTGQHLMSTLEGCSIQVTDTVGFLDREREPIRGVAFDFPAIVAKLQRHLKAPERKIWVDGYARTGEARTPKDVQRLALARARTVVERLVAAGMPRSRVEARLGGPPYQESRDVRFALEPDQHGGRLRVPGSLGSSARQARGLPSASLPQSAARVQRTPLFAESHCSKHWVASQSAFVQHWKPAPQSRGSEQRRIAAGTSGSVCSCSQLWQLWRPSLHTQIGRAGEQRWPAH
jgi:hypothetical protein